MTRMFISATSFNGDQSKWVMSSVTTMTDKLNSVAYFNGGISKWDLPRVVTTSGVFTSATPLDGDISRCTGMSSGTTSPNGDVSTWDMSYA